MHLITENSPNRATLIDPVGMQDGQIAGEVLDVMTLPGESVQTIRETVTGEVIRESIKELQESTQTSTRQNLQTSTKSDIENVSNGLV